MSSDKYESEDANEMENDAIYENICNIDLGDELEKLKSENKKLEDCMISLQLDIEKLAKALTDLKTLQENFAKNISSLFKTAQSEMERKDRMIADLRKHLDDITFRRFGNKNITNHNNVSNQTVVKSENARTICAEIMKAEKTMTEEVESKCQLSADNTNMQRKTSQSQNLCKTNFENSALIEEDNTINVKVNVYNGDKREDRIDRAHYDERLPIRNDRKDWRKTRSKSDSDRNSEKVQRESRMNYNSERENKKDEKMCQLNDKYKSRNSEKAAYLGNNEYLMINRTYIERKFFEKSEREDRKKSMRYHDSSKIYDAHLKEDGTINRQDVNKDNLEKLDEQLPLNDTRASGQCRSRSLSGSSGKTDYFEQNGLEDEVINHSEVLSNRIDREDSTDNRNTRYGKRLSDRDENDIIQNRKYHDSNKMFTKSHEEDRPANRRYYNKERKFGRDLSLDRVDGIRTRAEKINRPHCKDRIFGEGARSGRIPSRSERISYRGDRFFNRYHSVNDRYFNRDQTHYMDEWTSRIDQRNKYYGSDEWLKERDRIDDNIRDHRRSKNTDRDVRLRIDENRFNENLDQDRVSPQRTKHTKLEEPSSQQKDSLIDIDKKPNESETGFKPMDIENSAPRSPENFSITQTKPFKKRLKVLNEIEKKIFEKRNNFLKENVGEMKMDDKTTDGDNGTVLINNMKEECSLKFETKKPIHFFNDNTVSILDNILKDMNTSFKKYGSKNEEDEMAEVSIQGKSVKIESEVETLPNTPAPKSKMNKKKLVKKDRMSPLKKTTAQNIAINKMTKKRNSPKLTTEKTKIEAIRTVKTKFLKKVTDKSKSTSGKRKQSENVIDNGGTDVKPKKRRMEDSRKERSLPKSEPNKTNKVYKKKAEMSPNTSSYLEETFPLAKEDKYLKTKTEQVSSVSCIKSIISEAYDMKNTENTAPQGTDEVESGSKSQTLTDSSEIEEKVMRYEDMGNVLRQSLIENTTVSNSDKTIINNGISVKDKVAERDHTRQTENVSKLNNEALTEDKMDSSKEGKSSVYDSLNKNKSKERTESSKLEGSAHASNSHSESNKQVIMDLKMTSNVIESTVSTAEIIEREIALESKTEESKSKLILNKCTQKPQIVTAPIATDIETRKHVSEENIEIALKNGAIKGAEGNMGLSQGESKNNVKQCWEKDKGNVKHHEFSKIKSTNDIQGIFKKSQTIISRRSSINSKRRDAKNKTSSSLEKFEDIANLEINESEERKNIKDSKAENSKEKRYTSIEISERKSKQITRDEGTYKDNRNADDNQRTSKAVNVDEKYLKGERKNVNNKNKDEEDLNNKTITLNENKNSHKTEKNQKTEKEPSSNNKNDHNFKQRTPYCHETKSDSKEKPSDTKKTLRDEIQSTNYSNNYVESRPRMRNISDSKNDINKKFKLLFSDSDETENKINKKAEKCSNTRKDECEIYYKKEMLSCLSKNENFSKDKPEVITNVVASFHINNSGEAKIVNLNENKSSQYNAGIKSKCTKGTFIDAIALTESNKNDLVSEMINNKASEDEFERNDKDCITKETNLNFITKKCYKDKAQAELRDKLVSEKLELVTNMDENDSAKENTECKGNSAGKPEANLVKTLKNKINNGGGENKAEITAEPVLNCAEEIELENTILNQCVSRPNSNIDSSDAGHDNNTIKADAIKTVTGVVENGVFSENLQEFYEKKKAIMKEDSEQKSSFSLLEDIGKSFTKELDCLNSMKQQGSDLSSFVPKAMQSPTQTEQIIISDGQVRKRITPVPVKDLPVYSFENILKTNLFPALSKDGNFQNSLHLTHDGEIPLLQLDDNHINNLPNEYLKNPDKNIINLLDSMNISNMECDIPKLNNLTITEFENMMDTSTPNENAASNVSDVSAGCGQSESSVQTPNVEQNSSVSRVRRRRCRLVVLD